ncbi:MAG: hypothetical protein ACJA1W_004745, partial [Akkermansiaceae bacterium]
LETLQEMIIEIENSTDSVELRRLN